MTGVQAIQAGQRVASASVGGSRASIWQRKTVPMAAPTRSGPRAERAPALRPAAAPRKAGGGGSAKRNVRTEAGRESFDSEVLEALKAAAWQEEVDLDIVWINAEKASETEFADVDGLLVPGGFGERGVEGKIALRRARTIAAKSVDISIAPMACLSAIRG